MLEYVKMRVFMYVVVAVALCVAVVNGQNEERAVEEIQDQSSLNVHNAAVAARRRVSCVVDLLIAGKARVKRQFGSVDSAYSLANANSANQHFGPNGFGASAANAQAQGFESHGPQGGFGASAANSGSQGGFTGFAGQSGR